MDYRIENDLLTVTVSEQGAELQSILGADGTEYLWQGDAAFWSGRAPVLFPYVARLTDGVYRYHGKTYPLPIHGFAHCSRFVVAGRTEKSLTLALHDSKQTYGGYPFSFVFSVTYTLERRTLLIAFSVENRSDCNMYFGLGAHPGFNVPLLKGLDFLDYYLEFSDPCLPAEIGLSADCFRTGVDTPYPIEEDIRLPLSHDLFLKDAIVLKKTAKQITLKSDKDPHAVTVTFPDMPYLGLWHKPRTNAPYLCIEPWVSLPSRQGVIEDIENQADLITLHGYMIYRNCWDIKFI